MLYTESLNLMRELGSPSDLPILLNALGFLTAFYLNDDARAIAWLEESLAICRKISGQFHVTIFTLVWLGRLTLKQGYGAQAAEWFRESLAAAREWDSKSGTASALSGLALWRWLKANSKTREDSCDRA